MNKEKKDAVYVSMTAQDMEHLENVRKYYEEYLGMTLKNSQIVKVLLSEKNKEYLKEHNN